MKHSFLASLVLLINLCVNAQTSFEVLISTDQHEKVVDVIEDYNNDYVIVGKREIFDLNITKGYALKLNPTGEILQEKEFILPDTALKFTSTVLLPDSNYLLIGMFGEDTVQSILGIKTNDEFEELSRKYYLMPSEYHWLQETKVYLCDNNIYLFGSTWNPDTDGDLYIYSISYNGDSLNSRIYQIAASQLLWAMLDKKIMPDLIFTVQEIFHPIIF